MSSTENGRLDGWKAVAEYLKRDESTVRRWEREGGLPVHSVPRKGERRSVYAFPAELEKWMNGRPSEAEVATSEDPASPIAVGQLEAESASQITKHGQDGHATVTKHGQDGRATKQRLVIARARPWASRSILLGGLLAVVVVSVALFIASRIRGSMHHRLERIEVKGSELRALIENGEVAWSYVLPALGIPPEKLEYTRDSRQYIGDIDGDGHQEALIVVDSKRENDGGANNSDLYCFSETGRLLWRYGARDTLEFGGDRFEPPWMIQDFVVYGNGPHKTIAVASVHNTWWPAIVATLDSSGREQGRFVNSGHVYALGVVEQAQRSYLLVGGISNAANSGILAVLDAHHVSGTSPEEPGSGYDCRNCAPGRPLQYFTFPRTELNVATFNTFNGVHEIKVFLKNVVVAAGEDKPPRSAVIYEFTRDLELRRASFSGGYWDLHRQLETEGKLHHSRDQCPERFGPRVVKEWDPEHGWQELHPSAVANGK